MTPTTLTLLFLCAAALSLCSAAAGGFFTLWALHVGRTGCNPLPKLPSVSLFKRRPNDEDDDDALPPVRQPRVGP